MAAWTSVLRMTAPVFIFGVILPFVDIGTDFRLIYRLFNGVLGCKYHRENGWVTTRECRYSKDIHKYCHENPEKCVQERHELLASVLLGKPSYL